MSQASFSGDLSRIRHVRIERIVPRDKGDAPWFKIHCEGAEGSCVSLNVFGVWGGAGLEPVTWDVSAVYDDDDDAWRKAAALVGDSA